MDYKDYKRRKTGADFWFKGKINLIETLMDKLCVGKKLKILNVGCGTGDDLKVLNKFGEVFI